MLNPLTSLNIEDVERTICQEVRLEICTPPQQPCLRPDRSVWNHPAASDSYFLFVFHFFVDRLPMVSIHTTVIFSHALNSILGPIT